MKRDTFVNTGNIKIALDSLQNIIYLDSSEYKFDLNIDTLKELTVFFTTLTVNTFSVDYNGNVYLSIFNFDKPDLIKINKKSPPQEFRITEWTEIDTC